MGAVLAAAAIMAGLGILFGSLLALAYRYLRVDEDPRLEHLDAMLPGNNCGACGAPGCRAFAEQLLRGERTPAQCSVSSPDGQQAIADFLGVAKGEQRRRVARLHCAGGSTQAPRTAEYDGFTSCRAAATVSGGGKACAWGCLGLADCARACNFGAIHMNDEALPAVSVERCTACGDCVTACPRDLFELLPLELPLLVQCRVPLAGDAARALCRVACDACGRCVQDAPTGALRMVDNLPVVDPELGLGAGPECTFRCPTGAIRWVTDEQFAAVGAGPSAFGYGGRDG